MNFFRSRLSSVRRPDGYVIRRKKRFDLLSGGICNPPYPNDMLANAWVLGITYPQSIKRLGQFLTADNISARTPNGGRAYPAQRKSPNLQTAGWGICLCDRERFMNVYQAVFLLFIWSFQEKSVILQRN